jgi:hypothetical protein
MATEWTKPIYVVKHRNTKPLWTPYEAFLRDLGCADTKDFIKKCSQLVAGMTVFYILLVLVCATGAR